MFGLDMSIVIMVALAGCSAGALAYVFLFNSIAEEKLTDRRLATVRTANTDRQAVRVAQDQQLEITKRRKSVQASLKELDEKQKARDKHVKRPPMRIQLRQAGLKTTVRRFYVYSALCGVFIALLVLVSGAPVVVVAGAFVAGGIGVPRWFLAVMHKRRIKKFLEEFPNAIDIIVRAVKAGLPLNDGIRLIASEAKEPVKSEFQRIVESQQLGLSIPDAAQRMYHSMPCPEANFFGIVIQIQSQAGGNLSEALGNLSRVLRDRKKMKAKVQALSMEAKASAAIIGVLPFIVAFLVYLSSPNYIMPLFVTSTGHIILGFSTIWMAIGIFVMKKMMNFDV